jgi:1-acyl-sn-glycerol-3-phosphate acyltransferase
MQADLSMPQTDPRESKRYFIEETPLRLVLVSLLRLGFHLASTWQVSGTEFMPKQGAVILAANHLTSYDVFFMQFVVPRPIFFMGKEELFRNPLLDPIFRRLGGFPVHRGTQDEWALRHAARVLEGGQVLGMFPEGTRSKGRGLHSAKTGVARLALQADCPIVPMALHGPQFLFKKFPQRTHVQLSLGMPVYPHPDDSPLALTERVMFALADMLPIEMRGAYRYKFDEFSKKSRQP